MTEQPDMNSTNPSQIANRTASAIANTIDLKSDQVPGLALIIQAALDERESDAALLCRAFCEGAARWEGWENPSKGELCVNALRYVLDVDARGCPELTPNARVALLENTGATSVL